MPRLLTRICTLTCLLAKSSATEARLRSPANPNNVPFVLFLERLNRFVDRLLGTAIDDDMGAFRCERSSDGVSDTGSAPTDQCKLIGELKIHIGIPDRWRLDHSDDGGGRMPRVVKAILPMLPCRSSA